MISINKPIPINRVYHNHVSTNHFSSNHDSSNLSSLSHSTGELKNLIKTPLLDKAYTLDLSPEFIFETLKYFIDCGERLTQMTKTYDDIDAVTRLLEEVSLGVCIKTFGAFKIFRCSITELQFLVIGTWTWIWSAVAVGWTDLMIKVFRNLIRVSNRKLLVSQSC